MAYKHSPLINTNWSIDTTSKSVITISTGLLTAALSDNVQPLAVLACEAYGATLPMCQEVCSKMEFLAKRRHTSHMMQRIGAAIGFAPGDSADQLASNAAGVRFLALAAAVLSFGSPFKAAQCIHQLLDESSPRKQLLPTVQQLKDLLMVLERKIACAGFADTLEIWDMILRSQDIGIQSVFSKPDKEGTSLNILDDKDVDQAEAATNVNEDLSVSHEIHARKSLKQDSDRSSLGTESEPVIAGDSSKIDSRRIQPGNRKTVPNTVIAVTKIKDDLDHDNIRNATSSGIVMETFSLPRLGFPNLFTGVWKTSSLSERSERSNSFRSHNNQESRYPPSSAIASIIRALSETERLGEATFTTIQTPPSTAVWVIAFVRWCLGVEPYIRVNDRDLVLKQIRSRVLVEIGNAGDQAFIIRTYKSLGGIDKLLWESQKSLRYAKPDGWYGMIAIKTFFNTRLRNLQSLHRLYHLKDSLLLLASKITDRIRDPSPWATKPFHSSQMLVMLVAKFLDIENPTEKLRSLNRSELEDTWSRLGIRRAKLVAELFLELLTTSMIENVHLQDDPDIFLVASSVHVHGIILPDLVEPVSRFLLGELPISDVLALKHFDAEDALLCLLGSTLIDLAGDRGLATSVRGQVAYLSVLESLTTYPRCMYQWRVFPGSLHYHGDTYAYIAGTGRSRFEDVCDFSEVSPSDYSSSPVRTKRISGNDDLWMCSIEDNHLLVYWVPNVELSSYIDIRLSMVGAEHLIFLDECRSTCPPLSRFSSDLVYCRTVAAALHDPQPRTFRVLCLYHGVHERFFAQATIGEEICSQREKGTTKLLAIACGNTCISCACNAATAFVDNHEEFFEDGPRVIIIT